MKKLTEAWLRAAQDDLDVIDRILLDDHLTHIVAFHAQQSLEKAFKALFEEHENFSRISNQPVFHNQPGNSRKMAGIAGNEN
jgi:hypothetical protein